jgi:hypothetical protein
MYRADLPMSMNFAPLVLGRLPVFAVVQVLLSELVSILYALIRADDVAVCVMVSSRWLIAR